jgi:enoyl-CoA hydratase/carnithine racemase
MNRPEKRNALDHQLLDDLDRAFAAAEEDRDVRVVVLSGAVPAGELDATVDGIAADVAAVPAEGQQQHKEALNTSLEILGVGALFRYHGQMNALGRLRRR